jgi:hypothetical protein
MRYSIRWLLAFFAYVSLASAAFATRSIRLADVVWLVSVCTIGYAALLALAARGQRRFMALGFVTFAVGYVVAWYVYPSGVPAMQIFSAAGYSVIDGDIYEPDPQSGRGGGMRYVLHMRPIIRTANAIGTLASGVVGCFLGALAYKHACRE